MNNKYKDTMKNQKLSSFVPDTNITFICCNCLKPHYAEEEPITCSLCGEDKFTIRQKEEERK